ncbi:MAG: GPR endopeptidase [Defluviitaleaceae bacterium]|nr:GPR endopeptidase [Defluviitaleaceae bacterium]
MKKFRTDLALEVCENNEEKIEGVEILLEEDEDLGITVTWVKIENENGAEKMGKPIGNYITLESGAMKENDTETHEEIAKILARKLGQLHKLSEEATILVVGLGNRYVTPDALGPKVCEKILVTRHLGEDVPDELRGKLRAVSALSPGVMGITGIETAEIIKGVAEKTTPDLIIAIDALAARKTSRINTTIQISDAGVNPGAGLGNRRMPLNRESMGVPVIAIGVPTVVDAATLVNDTMDKMLFAMSDSLPEGDAFFDMLNSLEENERYGLIAEILTNENMFVTPKDVDAVIQRLANIVSNTLNVALHPGITTDDINRYMD